MSSKLTVEFNDEVSRLVANLAKKKGLSKSRSLGEQSPFTTTSRMKLGPQARTGSRSPRTARRFGRSSWRRPFGGIPLYN